MDGDLLHLTWDLAPRMAKIPAGADIVWEFRKSGAYESAFYWMEEGSWTSVTLPVVDAEPEPLVSGGDANPSSTSTTQSPTSSKPSSTSKSSTSTALPASTTAQQAPTSTEVDEAVRGPSDQKNAPVLALPFVVAALVFFGLRRRL